MLVAEACKRPPEEVTPARSSQDSRTPVEEEDVLEGQLERHEADGGRER